VGAGSGWKEVGRTDGKGEEEHKDNCNGAVNNERRTNTHAPKAVKERERFSFFFSEILGEDFLRSEDVLRREMSRSTSHVNQTARKMYNHSKNNNTTYNRGRKEKRKAGRKGNGKT
jgi:hypothetical protein